VCSLPGTGPKTVFVAAHQKQNDGNYRQHIRMLVAAVKILVLHKEIHPKHSSFLKPVVVTHLVTAVSGISGLKLYLLHINIFLV